MHTFPMPLSGSLLILGAEDKMLILNRDFYVLTWTTWFPEHSNAELVRSRLIFYSDQRKYWSMVGVSLQIIGL